MKKYLYLAIIILCTLASAEVIHVQQGSAIPFIQTGIQTAQPGDTVVVHEGIYHENIFLGKDITLASQALFDGPADWQNNPHIMNTIIDGSEANSNQIFASCIYVFPPLDNEGQPINISPRIYGFTMQNGKGTRIRVENSLNNDLVTSERVGGAVMVNAVTPVFSYNRFLDNGTLDRAPAVAKGGAAYAGTDVDIYEIRDENPLTLILSREEAPDFSNNIFLNNHAEVGKSLYVDGYDGVTDVSFSFFDVYNCSAESVSPVWVTGSMDAQFDFGQGAGETCSIIGDVWVAPYGDDDTDSGQPEQPFRTISRALERIAATPEQPSTIHLAPGLYANFENGESFPLHLPDHVMLMGEALGPVVLDAAGSGTAIICHNSSFSRIERVAITGGNAQQWGGGAIAMFNTSLYLLNVTLVGNTADFGGAVYGDNGELIIVNSILWDNMQPQIFMTAGTYDGSVVVAYSDIQGGDGAIQTLPDGSALWLEGNLDEDPMFIGEFCLFDDSPCIDAGVSDTEIFVSDESELLFVPPVLSIGAAPDMGACENPNAGIMPGDVDGNNMVNVVDIVFLVDFALGAEPNPYQFIAGDLDGSGVLNVVDIVLLVDIILNQ